MNVIHDCEPLFIRAFFDFTRNKPYLFFPQGAMIPTFAQINDIVSIKFETNAFQQGVKSIDVYVKRFDSFNGEYKDGFQIGSVFFGHFMRGTFELNFKFTKEMMSGKSHHVLALHYVLHYFNGAQADINGMMFRMFSKDNVTEVRCNREVEESFQKFNSTLGVFFHWDPQETSSTRRKRKRSNGSTKDHTRKKKKIEVAKKESKSDKIVDEFIAYMKEYELQQLMEASCTFLTSFASGVPLVLPLMSIADTCEVPFGRSTCYE